MENELDLANKRFVLFKNDPQLRQFHVSSQADEDALQAALDARRPLLVRGEPGVGKTQLALAAAVALERAFISFTADALTEPRELHYWEDAVERLAQAQVSGVQYQHTMQDKNKRSSDVMDNVAREKFVRPGPLWWAYQWDTARNRSSEKAEPPQPSDRCSSSNGVVLLIDEIDKADPSFPNGLLEALGQRSFTPPGKLAEPIRPTKWPMVIITSNDERRLPDAFIRRCVVYDMVVPAGDEFVNWLVKRGKQHFPLEKFPGAEPEFLKKVAVQVRSDREALAGKRPLPGQAEYLDLLRALFARGPQSTDELNERLKSIGRYFLRKHGQQTDGFGGQSVDKIATEKR